jgi:hypothetical protein
MRRPDATLARTARGAAACALAWALTLAGWLALGALGRATTPLWFAGLAPLACWLALSVALMTGRASPSLPRGGDPVATLAAGLVAAVAFISAARGGSAIAAFVAAGAWAVVSSAAWRAAGVEAATASARRAQLALIVPAIAGATLAWWVAGDLDGGVTLVTATRLALFVLGSSALLAPLARHRLPPAEGVAASSCLIPSSASAGAGSWAAAAARWTMLPTMAAMGVAGDWCASGGVTARDAMALHFAAMLVPALVVSLAGKRLNGSAWIVAAMLAGVGASLAWPGARGWLAMSLLHAAAWSLAWAQAARRAPAVARTRPASHVRAAALPALAVLALGIVLSRFGIAGLVAVHAGLGLASATGALAWALRPHRCLEEIHS